jgi:hypothetical protein
MKTRQADRDVVEAVINRAAELNLPPPGRITIMAALQLTYLHY